MPDSRMGMRSLHPHRQECRCYKRTPQTGSLQGCKQRSIERSMGEWRQERDAAVGTVLMEKGSEMTQYEVVDNSVGGNALQEM